MRLTATREVKWAESAPPSGVKLGKVYVGPDPVGLGGIQIAVAESDTSPTRQVLRDLHSARKGKTAVQLVVVVVHDGTAHLIGPDAQALPIELPVEQAERQLQSVLAEPDLIGATERLAGFRKANDSTGHAGFTNSGLFATHHIMSNVPKRSDWEALGKQAAPLLGLRSRKLVEALGFVVQPGVNGTLTLSLKGEPPRAVAILLEDSEHFDAKATRFQLSPVAFGLAVAAREGLPWLVVLRKDQIRLYPGQDGVGVGSKGQSDTFFEIDLSTIEAEYAALLPLIFSAGALSVDGSADELLRDSARFASDLGARLRERIYEEIVPPMAVEVAMRLHRDAGLELDAEGLQTAYRVTLRILFRLLFQAYAEDRGLLPSGRNEGFDANSLKTNARRLSEATAPSFGDSSTIWFDLVQVWSAIDQGNPHWQIPAYNGGLFSGDPSRSPDGALIKRIELPDSVLGPALRSLLIDVSPDGVPGPVDFRSLSVREFGTIYEGLLESSLSLASQDLTVDSKGAWVPAGKGDNIEAVVGAVYFHTASGERKATGSYFTPKVVVDHLIERSIVPALGAHLQKIAGYLEAGDEAKAGREFFDFRVADLAMGSGHFLVAAVDKIEALMRTFLTERSVPSVTEELMRLAGVATQALGTDDVAKSEVDEIGLLRRQIARRCIYGLDINPMAVELARLALWIHTFVPGLPMSNLDHGLVCANSLTGIGTIDEALDALQPGRKPGEITLFDEILTDQLASSKTLLIDVANASEASKAEVEEGTRILAQAREAADTARRIFDAAVAGRIGRIEPGLIMDRDSLEEVLSNPEVAEVAAELRPAHMPYLFPEVFLRDKPGFDVLLGNPPWEKLHVEEHQWWGLRLPGLRSLPQQERDRTLKKFRASRRDLEVEFLREVEAVAAMNLAVSAGPFPGLGAAHLDLFGAFAWRNWQLLRSPGLLGVVLPRGALGGSGLAEWRRTVLRSGAFEDVCFIENTARWAFDMEARYTIAFTVVSKGRDHIVRWSGPFSREIDFQVGANDLAVVDADEFAGWSASCAFPLIPSVQAAEIFRQMKRSPGLAESRTNWEFRPLQGDLNATSERSVLEFDVTEAFERIPVVTGASFNLWNPDAGPPKAYGLPEVLRPYLQAKLERSRRLARSAYYGLTFAGGDLPFDSPRIVFRDMVRSTDTRTMICCLLPPGTAAMEKAPVMVQRQGGAKETAALLGVMSSIPFDWYMRRWVEMKMSFELLSPSPIPVVDVGMGLGHRVMEVSARLAAVDDRYANWAAEVGVLVGSVTTQAEKDDLIAELDALVSLLYGLSADQVEHIFATFHRGWEYQQRLDAVLTHYAAWKDKA